MPSETCAADGVHGDNLNGRKKPQLGLVREITIIMDPSNLFPLTNLPVILWHLSLDTHCIKVPRQVWFSVFSEKQEKNSVDDHENYCHLPE